MDSPVRPGSPATDLGEYRRYLCPTSVPNEVDSLAPARGILVGLVLAVPMWVVIAMLTM